jgi:hypothetical protein
LEGIVIPRGGNLASRIERFKQIAIPILESPIHAADWRVGGTRGRAFLGQSGGTDIVVVAKERRWQGKVFAAFVPDSKQLHLFLSR